MRSALRLALFGSTSLICSQSASALPSLVSRQTCETIFCPNLDESSGAVLNWLLQDPVDQETLPLPPVTNDDQATPEPPTVTNTDPQFEIFVTAQPQDLEACQATSAPVLPGGVGNVVANTQSCDEATERIIWPASCEDLAANTITETIVSEMDNQYWTSINPLCPSQGGVAFWVASLTRSQVLAIRGKQGTSVRDITPNTPFSMSDLRRVPAPQTKAPVEAKTNQFKKRGSLYVKKQPAADRSLTFLSTPEGKSNENRGYAYLSSGIGSPELGKSIRIYVIDTGYDWLNTDFQYHASVRWLYAGGVRKEESDTDPGGHGTCIFTKIGGRRYGVFKEAEMVMVKIKPKEASLLSALSKIILDCQKDIDMGNDMRGYFVINISGGWIHPDGAPLSQLLMDYMQNLVVSKYAVVVTSAGRDEENSWGEIVHMPAGLAGSYDIITVGAVDPEPGPNYGARFAWSRGGDNLAVSGPGRGMCQIPDDKGFQMEGPSIAGAVVSGLVAYFLSIPELNAYFRSQPNLPLAVKEFLQSTMSIRRYQAQKSVWNGLDFDDDTLAYDPRLNPWQYIPTPLVPQQPRTDFR